ncbi:hypothetical protein MSPP1_004044 [Malassezia sp. CBS 17886]|nr:hypothetical protein MSPP1_004044 [Malassezia sp. CBS 17886]
MLLVPALEHVVTLVCIAHAHRTLAASAGRRRTPPPWGQSVTAERGAHRRRVGTAHRRAELRRALCALGIWSAYLCVRPWLLGVVTWVVPFWSWAVFLWLVWMLLNVEAASHAVFSRVRPRVLRYERWIDFVTFWGHEARARQMGSDATHLPNTPHGSPASPLRGPLRPHEHMSGATPFVPGHFARTPLGAMALRKDDVSFGSPREGAGGTHRGAGERRGAGDVGAPRADGGVWKEAAEKRRVVRRAEKRVHAGTLVDTASDDVDGGRTEQSVLLAALRQLGDPPLDAAQDVSHAGQPSTESVPAPTLRAAPLKLPRKRTVSPEPPRAVPAHTWRTDPGTEPVLSLEMQMEEGGTVGGAAGRKRPADGTGREPPRRVLRRRIAQHRGAEVTDGEGRSEDARGAGERGFTLLPHADARGTEPDAQGVERYHHLPRRPHAATLHGAQTRRAAPGT